MYNANEVDARWLEGAKSVIKKKKKKYSRWSFTRSKG